MNEELTLVGDQLDLIKRTVAKDTTDDELQLFLYTCRRTGLDPLTKQIHCVKRKGQMAIQTGIDGYRVVADRTGKYAGNDDPIFDSEERPRKATVTVYKIVDGQRCAFSATARWDQYFPGEMQGFMWKKMPHLMLGKCAEALALRKAFPQSLSGIYTHEEMEQADQPESRPAGRKYEIASFKDEPKKKPKTEKIELITEAEWESTVADINDKESMHGDERKPYWEVQFANGKAALTYDQDLAGKAFELIPSEGEDSKTVKASVKLGKSGKNWYLKTLEVV